MSTTTTVMACALAVTILGVAPSVSADQPGDAWITTKVKMALLTSDSVDAFDIDVDTVDGLVTLHGKAASEQERSTATDRARNVEGVRDVRNLLVVVPEAAEEATRRSDEDLARRVGAALEADAALEGNDIRVQSVNDGVVLLAGEAGSLSAHRRALEDARGVDGVRQVVSEIRSPDELADREIWQEETEADPVALSSAAGDAWITTKAKVRLMTETGVSPMAVNVDTRRGVVTLFGTVETEAIKERAGAEVARVAGVKSLRNELQVVPAVSAEAVEASDEDLSAGVKERLGSRPALEDADVSVEVSDGVVRLTGQVASQSDRMTVLTVARGTPGARSVIDDLSVRSGAAE